jgi:hypothetical protein
MPSDLPPSDPVKTCEERARLLRDYADSASAYANRVREMAALVMSGQEHLVSQVRAGLRVAWDETEKNRLALYRHESDHQCDRGADVSSICR